jgi:hypothetical protein
VITGWAGEQRLTVVQGRLPHAALGEHMWVEFPASPDRVFRGAA